ncbi:dipeptide epimerase [Xinfangfangia sp. CPCC 101601]|uniref:Dipeptide epimerase n=1 Tax=Pseudogemmobacter lacusdianii TaxID=3069608 RepID=A0ABU0VXB5_9RHOB|nr:N-acetyl-D-Glu racemase DgcA [Xinfangfangia sp. CPCC 101601]MDQ2066378.1 dipeptide epimerase [Xinfangfangia sp. CPCC 101601]
MIQAEAQTFALRNPFTISRGSKTEARVVTATITRQGHRGWGEALPYPRYGETVEETIAAIHALPQDITREALQSLMPAGAARNAVDCALWDLEAKASGRAVWQLAGLQPPQPVEIAFTLSLDTPENMREAAARNAHRAVLKVKLGTPSDMPRIEAVRQGAPHVRLIVDANEGWTPEVYTDLARHLIRLGVEMVEQPLPQGADDMLAEIARPLPVCADESAHDAASLRGLIGKYDVVNLKLDKTGGLTEALKARDQARQLGLKVMVGCMVASSLSMAPAILVAQGADWSDLDGPADMATDRSPPVHYDDRRIHPAAPELWG